MLAGLYVLDVVGTLAFAMFGAYVGVKRKFDVFGVFAVAFLTALGGGTVREVVLGNVPFYFFDPLYVVTVGVGCVAAIVVYPVFSRVRRVVLVVDAVGLATFAFIGASQAAQAGLGVLGVTVLAAISAAGGGLLRDMAISRTPQVFYRDFYVSPAIILGIAYSALGESVQEPLVAGLLILGAFALRLVAIVAGVSLWVPWGRGKREIDRL